MGTTGYQQIISIGTYKGVLLKFGQKIVYVDCEKEGERTEPWGRHSLKVLEGPMEQFTCTLAVRFMNREDSHSVKRQGMPIFDIFIRSPVLQMRSYTRLMSKKVAMVLQQALVGGTTSLT